MSWTITLLNDILVSMLLTSLSGGVLVVIWLGIGRLLEKLGFINIVYELLKMVILFFFVPISYIGLKMFEGELGSGFLFTPISDEAACLWMLLSVWLLIAGAALLSLGCEMLMLNRYFRDAVEANRQQRRVLEETCARLGLPVRKAELRCSYKVDVPCVMGIRRARVILPMEHYDTDTLQVILAHELTHFQQQDLLLKRISLVVLSLHFFNPFAWLLYEEIQKWSEFACDYRAHQYCGSVKHYFEVLLRIAMGEQERESLTSHLYESRHELVERMRKMKSVSMIKKRRKFSAALVVCVAMMCSSTSVYAATMQTARVYEYLYRASETQLSAVDYGEDNYIEYTESGETPGITLLEKPINTMSRSTHFIDWAVDGRCRVSGPYMELNEGQKVAVSVNLVPADVEVKVGLENAAGSRKYVLMKDFGTHAFNVDSHGYYRVYIQNDSYTDVTTDGSYVVSD